MRWTVLLLNSRCLMGSTNQADLSCFDFRILWKSAIFHSIKLPFDAEVAEKNLNGTYLLFMTCQQPILNSESTNLFFLKLSKFWFFKSYIELFDFNYKIRYIENVKYVRIQDWSLTCNEPVIIYRYIPWARRIDGDFLCQSK